MSAWLCSTGNESNFRTAAYEALTSYCSHASTDTIVTVQNTAVAILQRMEQLLAMHVRVVRVVYPISILIIILQNQILGVDDRNNWNEIQGNLCGVSIVRYYLFFLIDKFFMYCRRRVSSDASTVEYSLWQIGL